MVIQILRDTYKICTSVELVFHELGVQMFTQYFIPVAQSHGDFIFPGWRCVSVTTILSVNLTSKADVLEDLEEHSRT